MTVPDSQIYDPLGWLEELRDALDDPAVDTFTHEALPSPEVRRAAYRLSVAIGHCRLFGIEPPDDTDGTLPAAEAIVAAEKLREFVEAWTEDARQLGARWDEEEPEVGEALCAEVLEGRMEAWAAFVSIDEAYYDCKLAREPVATQFDAALDRLLDALDQFDDVLQEPDNLALLSMLTGTELLKNWLRLLAGRYREVLPWWLNGTLEAAERRIERELAASEPGRGTGQHAPEPLKPEPRSRTASTEGYRSHRQRILAIQRTYSTTGTSEQSAAPFLPSLKWTSPGGELHARLLCPARAAADELLPLVFEHDDDRAAVDLSGMPTWLAGLEAQIDEQGRARFNLTQLRLALKQGGEPALEVGPGRALWPPLPAEDADFDTEVNDGGSSR